MPGANRHPTTAVALHVPRKDAELRLETLAHYGDTPQIEDSAGNEENEYPTIQKFYQQNGNQAILDMTSFWLNEFNAIYASMSDHIKFHYKQGERHEMPNQDARYGRYDLHYSETWAKWDLIVFFSALRPLLLQTVWFAWSRCLSDYSIEMNEFI